MMMLEDLKKTFGHYENFIKSTAELKALIEDVLYTTPWLGSNFKVNSRGSRNFVLLVISEVYSGDYIRYKRDCSKFSMVDVYQAMSKVFDDISEDFVYSDKYDDCISEAFEAKEGLNKDGSFVVEDSSCY